MTYTIDYEGPTPVDEHLKEILTENPIRLMGYRQNGLFTENHRESLQSHLQDEARVEITDDVIAEQTDRLTDEISLTDIIDINFQSVEQSAERASNSPPTVTGDLSDQIVTELEEERSSTYSVESNSSGTVSVTTDWSHTNE